MKDLSYYLQLRYATVLQKDDEGDWVANIQELPGCSAHGSSEAEALQNLAEAKHLWIEDAIERGHVVPEPNVEEELPSGKWLQRVPRSLHKRLAEYAHREDVSLNQLVTSILAEALGRRAEVPATAHERDAKATFTFADEGYVSIDERPAPGATTTEESEVFIPTRH